ncbi:DEAD/DEAH box helicase [Streptomyces sp. H39-S7]|uniref:DEAD/DEAH box helicase n=1 Tax=Streptomyces sp. H39-S7 TaxID=3004357 RepID=UPI0022AFA210|nr:DEAD/DEAH box helicase [Streptomyces sp. H39-S7]MCZ4119559.1 DEAD/DEAH box helicase [Streptomyces sp. H39-S7]
MFALHAQWRADQRLALWAEDSRQPPVPAPGHPYAVPGSAVAELLGDGGPALGWLAGRAGAGATGLLLPTRDGAPLPSPELGGPTAVQGVPLAPWTVPCLLFEPADAALLLGELSAAGLPEAPYGASLRWLIAAHDLAWRTVGRGRLLPVLADEAGAPYARWRPVRDDAGWQEAGELAAAAPRECHAGHHDGRPDGRTAATILTDLLDVLTDREARAVLDDEPELLRTARGRRPAMTATELWLRALTSPTGRIEGADPAELAELADQLTAWHRSEPPVHGPLRVCFRLVEPVGPDPADPRGHPSDDNWRLDFLLQAADEPSLMVHADDVWSEGPALSALERKTARPQEALLSGLDRAGRAYPELHRALRGNRPAGLPLDRVGALGFLRDAAPALTDAGFGVLLPTWWQRPQKLGMALTVRTPQPGAVDIGSLADQDAIVAFRWQAALGDQPLTAAELTELAAAKQPLIRIRGQWTEVDPDRIAAALAFLERDGSGATDSGRILRIALDPDATAGGLPVASVSADGRLGELLSGTADQRLRPVAVPEGFGSTLRPYQERGLAWLRFLSELGIGAVLADDMGLGKTAQALALLAVEHAERSERAERAERVEQAGRAEGRAEPTARVRPTLLVCPMSLVGNWRRETARFAPMLRVYVHHGAGRLSGPELREAVADADLVITTYGLVQRDTEALTQTAWRRVIIDEAQHVKNSATRQYRAVRELTADHRIALTGTPVENRLAELHAILDFANPGLFGSAIRFKERYAVPIERDGSEAAAQALRKRTRPFVLRRLKSDPAISRELPAKQEMTVLCNLTAEQAALYQAVVTDLLQQIKESRGIERKGLVLASLSKLKQVCNHPAQFAHDGSPLAGRSGKVARLEETLEEALAEGDKTLCFTQFAEFGSLLQGHLAERLDTDVLFLHGGVPQRARDEMIERFQDRDGPSVFLLSLKAGGTGLNLTAANQVIHVDRWWNPAVEEQATDRAFRIGQRRDVQVRKFVCVGTVEERIDAMIEAKRTVARAAVGSGEGWLTELSTEALYDLVGLGADAVSE